MTTNFDAYHNHLDHCQRCNSQPFNLCPLGAMLIEAAVHNPWGNSNPGKELRDKCVFVGCQAVAMPGSACCELHQPF